MWRHLPGHAGEAALTHGDDASNLRVQMERFVLWPSRSADSVSSASQGVILQGNLPFPGGMDTDLSTALAGVRGMDLCRRGNVQVLRQSREGVGHRAERWGFSRGVIFFLDN